MLDAQMTKLLTKLHHTPQCEDKLNENFTNRFSECRYRPKSTDDRRWESMLGINIPKFQGSGQPKEFGLY